MTLKLAIDASNIRSGGGLAHLSAILWHAPLESVGFEKVVIWCNPSVASHLAPLTLNKVEVIPDSSLRGSPAQLMLWHVKSLPRHVQESEPDIIWAPGGIISPIVDCPTVAMSQNLLPFESEEVARYGLSSMRLKLIALRRIQTRSFRKADGVMFLTEHARAEVIRRVPDIRHKSVVIPHGVDDCFLSPPRLPDWKRQRPVRLLYVSPVDLYKHQWHVVSAVGKLLQQGFEVELDLVGSEYPPAQRKLDKAVAELPAARARVSVKGPAVHASLPAVYRSADIFVFASTCEALPITLLEAMASGLPIACSDRRPMPEVLGNAGVYLDPENPESIVNAIRSLLEDPGMAYELAERAFERASAYSWARCAFETFTYLHRVAVQ